MSVYGKLNANITQTNAKNAACDILINKPKVATKDFQNCSVWNSTSIPKRYNPRKLMLC